MSTRTVIIIVTLAIIALWAYGIYTLGKTVKDNPQLLKAII